MRHHPAALFQRLLLILGAFWAVAGHAVQPESVVGEITTLIGRASVVDRTGQPRELQRGAAVHAGDLLETEASGHLHIRFIDGGLVSVRPRSRLHIEDYSRSDGTRQGAIKFNLQHGVVRSVTGSWGEADRERFRLNTPVVAIGVKGTDFIVRAQGGKTQAAVVSGAIVMTPLSECANALGSCNGQQTVQLGAEMPGQMLEYDTSHGAAAPRLVPATDLEARLDPTAVALAAKNLKRSRGDLASDVEHQMGDVYSTTAGNSLDPAAPVLPADAPMVWVQNPFGWNIAPNSIAQRLDKAELAGRQAAVSNFYQTLYRDETTRNAYAGGSGKASFALSEGSASYSTPDLAFQPVSIEQATFDVDFNKQRYTTQLDLAGSFGNSRFTASGQISPSGTFKQDTPGEQGINGALSRDARQAGYLFHQQVGEGVVSGATLWRR